MNSRLTNKREIKEFVNRLKTLSNKKVLKIWRRETKAGRYIDAELVKWEAMKRGIW